MCECRLDQCHLSASRATIGLLGYEQCNYLVDLLLKVPGCICVIWQFVSEPSVGLRFTIPLWTAQYPFLIVFVLAAGRVADETCASAAVRNTGPHMGFGQRI